MKLNGLLMKNIMVLLHVQGYQLKLSLICLWLIKLIVEAEEASTKQLRLSEPLIENVK